LRVSRGPLDLSVDELLERVEEAAAVGNRGADRTLVLLLEEEAVPGGLSVISRLACSRYLKGGTS
jgi:hypothetical protein